jgi:hypothetical protein
MENNSSNADDSDRSGSDDEDRKRRTTDVKLEPTKPPAAAKMFRKTNKTLLVPILSRVFTTKQLNMENFKL